MFLFPLLVLPNLFGKFRSTDRGRFPLLLKIIHLLLVDEIFSLLDVLHEFRDGL